MTGIPHSERARQIADALAVEQEIIAGLSAAYHAGKLSYLHFSPAYDVTAARCLALEIILQESPPQ